MTDCVGVASNPQKSGPAADTRQVVVAMGQPLATIDSLLPQSQVVEAMGQPLVTMDFLLAMSQQEACHCKALPHCYYNLPSIYCSPRSLADPTPLPCSQLSINPISIRCIVARRLV